MKSRSAEFAKGALLPLPFLLVLGLLSCALVGRDGDWPAWILLGWCALTVLTLVSLAARAWNRSRWWACGTLASLAVCVVLVVLAALVLLTAIGSAIKG